MVHIPATIHHIQLILRLKVCYLLYMCCMTVILRMQLVCSVPDWMESTLPGLVALFAAFPVQVEDVVCEALKASSPSSTISNIPEQQLMKIFCLSAFTVMLGRCCRGWGKDEVVANQLRGQADGCSGCFLPQEGSSTKVPTVTQLVRGRTQQPVQGQCRPKTAHRSMTGGRLDLGSFLIGVEITARDLDPDRMAGVFGPLTNGW